MVIVVAILLLLIIVNYYCNVPNYQENNVTLLKHVFVFKSTSQCIPFQ